MNTARIRLRVHVWKKVAQVVDAAVELLDSDAGADLMFGVHWLMPRLASRVDSLRGIAAESARGLLGRIEDDVLLSACVDANAGARGDVVSYDVVRRRLGLGEDDEPT